MADNFSETIVFGNSFVLPKVFDVLNVRLWGVGTKDRFASEKNLKTINTKYICPKTLGADKFIFDWAREVNWLVPPVQQRYL